MRTAHRIRDLRRHRGPVTRIAISPNGRLLASGGSAEPVIIWDVASGKPLRYVALPKNSSATCLDFAYGSRFLAIGSQNGSLIMVDTETAPGTYT